jgi:hypothetical protein
MSNSFEIALSLDIPGKGSPTGCEIFADALYDLLTSAGIRARVIGYHWRGTAGDILGIEENHAIVLYNDEDGHDMAMDSVSENPRWLPKNLFDSEAAQWFAGDDREVSNIVTLKP